jgi:predicted TIM-barrel fold metal-dependent hydrolase
MQNIHSHTWNEKLHFAPETVKETELSRGCPIDLTVDFDAFMKDTAPFERVAVFGLKAKLTGYWVPDEYVADFVKKAPGKLKGFASCDPTQKGYMEELKYAVEKLRLAGLKMGPVYAGFDPRDKRCGPVYDYCEKNSIPVIFHSGTTFNRVAPLGYSRPWLFDEIAIKYPGLKIVLAHLGHPYCDECIAVIRKHPNMYADISALYYRPWQFYNAMLLAQEYKVMDKLLFGTDYPFIKSQESIDGVRSINKIIGDSPLPKVSLEAIEEILERDSLSLLGIKK